MWVLNCINTQQFAFSMLKTAKNARRRAKNARGSQNAKSGFSKTGGWVLKEALIRRTDSQNLLDWLGCGGLGEAGGSGEVPHPEANVWRNAEGGSWDLN